MSAELKEISWLGTISRSLLLIVSLTIHFYEDDLRGWSTIYEGNNNWKQTRAGGNPTPIPEPWISVVCRRKTNYSSSSLHEHVKKEGSRGFSPPVAFRRGETELIFDVVSGVESQNVDVSEHSKVRYIVYFLNSRQKRHDIHSVKIKKNFQPGCRIYRCLFTRKQVVNSHTKTFLVTTFFACFVTICWKMIKLTAEPMYSGDCWGHSDGGGGSLMNPLACHNMATFFGHLNTK